ncbi:OmpA family protein [Flavihumibacter profundi]|uniref:OmpA family protein n=1 Tax=Flavihumibacter profundi TaxID=2716883 RepID=UPI001CC3922C|nr:OmpA family protein [Flavihumibacter profundi]MBZ5857671.1 OmpA family protein [Flavihumibacter profundi]
MKLRYIAACFLLFMNSRQLAAQVNDSLTQVYSKFDFIPGEKVIFFDDFSSENIGDFPTLWNTNGSGEVVTYGKYPGKWLKVTNSKGITCLADTLKLPENYTIEFDVIPQKDQANNNNTTYRFMLISTSKPKDLLYGLARPGDAGIWFEFAYNNSYFTWYRDGSPGLDGRTTEHKQVADNKYHISIWVQKERIRIYQDEAKLFDAAKAMSKNYKYNMIRFDRGVELIGNLRIATGLPDMRNKLLTEGKLVSYGIYFDVNSDKLKPESAGTLKEIATILTENPALRVKIVGHTDSDGDDATNLDLSKRRAAAVKIALNSSFNIDAARLETDGKGEKEPIAPNNSNTNKALNRRVEFIKL